MTTTQRSTTETTSGLTITIHASGARRSQCHDREDARDVDVAVWIGDACHTGEVTLLKREDRACEWSSWGDPEHWVDSVLLAWIHDLAGDGYSEVLGELGAVAGKAVRS